MPSIETTDWLAIKARLDGLVTVPEMSWFEPGALVTPPSDASGPTPFILVSDIVNDPVRIGISARGESGVDHIRSGTLLLTVQWPIARPVTHAQLREVAGQIAAHFSADTRMSYGSSKLRVQQDATVVQPYVEGAYRVSIVRVSWRSV
ncbi:phage tail terminator-like protein [Novosphingobium sp. B1]|uniref:phage tail terminator-like protein n=1 Tax=Novosphingobium sp. B1 TaxID=1938756 RepID=UPI0009D8CA49|nr:phage tail terminator-like protein [Novosphingobium sp. B1]SMC97183.1 Bacteriophage related protein of unknown function [Novosphingobium sp. B1]